MQNRLRQIQRNAQEFLLDMHAITRNFFGENDWKWLKKAENADGKKVDEPEAGVFQRFKEEMMSGTQFYSNDSNIEDRISLAICSSLYSLPYAAGRLVYDGVLNAVEYASSRTTDSENNPLHPEPRQLNGYVLGVPVSISLILAMGAAECGFRAAGFTAYAGHVISAAGMRAANLSRYTRNMFGRYTPEEINTHQSAVLSLPTNGWEVADRFGLVTIPGALAATELVGAAGITVLGGVFETSGRVAGLTSYGGHVMAAAGKRAANLSRYTRAMFGTYDNDSIRANQNVVFSLPTNGWGVLDRVGLVTIPGVVAVTELVGAASITAIGGVGETVGRLAGASAYGGHIICAAGKRAANLSRYTRKMFGTYDDASVLADQNVVFSLPTNGWGVLDRVGLVTIPGAVAVVELVGAASITAVAGSGEVIGRFAGVSAYGGHVIKAAGKRAANLSRYTRAIFNTYDDASVHSDQDVVLSMPTNGWGVLDRIGLVTIPGTVALLELVGAASLTAVAGSGEAVSRMLGVSEYGGHVIKAAGKRAANLSRYTRKMFTTYDDESIRTDQAAVLSMPTNGWGALDRVGLVTIPGVVAVAELAGALLITVIGGTGEVISHLAGVSEYGGHVIKAAGKRAVNLSRYTRMMFNKTYDDASIRADQDAVLSLPTNGWGVLDRISLATLPGVIAIAELAGAALITTIGGIGEALGRVLGVSEYGRHVVRSSGKRAANVSRYTRKMFGTHDDASIHADQDTVLSLPTNGWGVLDRLSLFTIPGAIAVITFAGAVCVTAVAGVGEALARVVGISSYGGHVVKSAGKRAANLSRYTRKMFGTYDDKSIHENQDTVFSLPADVWGVFDRMSLLTIPGALAVVELALSATITVVAGVGEAVLRMAGFSSYGQHVMRAAGKRAANVSRYTRAIFGTYDDASIQADQSIVFSKPANGWGVFDRVGLVTMPGIIAVFELVGAVSFSAVVGILETVSRGIGLNRRASHARDIVSAKSWNMLGLSDPKNLDARMQTVKAPVKSWWDAMDCVGVFISCAAKVAINVGLIAPFALVGLSKSNYHRFNYLRHRVDNVIHHRQGNDVDQTLEKYHKDMLAKCEQTKIGNFFSKINVFNVVGRCLYSVARYIMAPVVYGGIRAAKQLFGIIPAVKGIYRIFKPIQYDLTDPVDRVKKRFADLKKILSASGHFPVALGEEAYSQKMEESLQTAKPRNILERAAVSFLTECRKIASLGHTPEEKVLVEFNNRFEEFVRIRKNIEKRGVTLNVSAFFTRDVPVKNGHRFSYEETVNYIKDRYSSAEDLAAIDKVAAYLKGDIEEKITHAPAPV